MAKKKKTKVRPRKVIVVPVQPEEPPSMYWEGEDGEGYKEDGHPCLYKD